jgi:hypothetical protein
MNEQEIAGEIGQRMGLNGITVKPLSYDSILNILKYANIEFTSPHID